MRTTSGDMGGDNLMERRAIVSPELPSLLVGLTFGRPMRLRLALCVAMACIVSALTGGAVVAAQEASPYLPPQHRAVPDMEHLIAGGRVAGSAPPTPPRPGGGPGGGAPAGRT